MRPEHPLPAGVELRPMEDRVRPASSVSISGSELEEERLLASAAAGYLSDDGTTPLVPGKGPSRQQQLLHYARVTLRFLLANWYKFVVLGIIITLIVLVSVKGFSIFGVILRWFQARNNWAGWGIFVGMYCGVVALFLPGVVFIMGAGFVFGFWKGLLAVWIGGAVGQALAFLLARYLLKDWVESFVRGKWKKWEYIDKAIELDGWKLVLIMRFSPLIPYNLLNIAMATTSMPFWQFTIVSAIGIVWECAVFCYFGSMAENITSIAAGEGMSGPFEWVMLGISIVMCVVGALFVSIMIKKAVKRAEAHMSTPSLVAVAAAAMSEAGGGSPPGLAAGGRPVVLEREGFFSSGGVHAFARLSEVHERELLKPSAAAAGAGHFSGVSGSRSELSAAGAAVGRKLKVSGPDHNSGSNTSGEGGIVPAGKRDLEMGHSPTLPKPRRRQSGSMSAEDF